MERVLSPSELLKGKHIWEMATDDSHLYLATADELFRVAKSGGQPEYLWSGGFRFDFVVRDDDVLINDGLSVISLAKDGAQETTLAKLDDFADDFVLDGDTMYYTTSDYVSSELYSLDLRTSVSVRIADGLPLWTEGLVKLGDSLYLAAEAEEFAALESRPDNTPAPIDTLYRINATGGEPEVVPVTFGDGTRQFTFDLLGADGDALVASARAVPTGDADLTQFRLSGAYRVSPGKGTAVQLLDGDGALWDEPEFDIVNGRYLFFSSEYYEVFYRGPISDSAVTRSFCVDEVIFSWAADSSHDYLQLQDDDDRDVVYRRRRAD